MKESKITTNFIYQSLYQVLIILIPIFTAPYISRVLGADGVGIYSYTYSIASYFALAAKLGIHVYGNRCIAFVRDDKEKLNQTFSDLLAIHILWGLVVLFAYGIHIITSDTKYKIIVIVQSIYVIAEIFEINWLFFGLEKFKITVTRNSIIKILSLLAIFLFVKTKNDVWKYCTIMAVGMGISELAVWIFVPRYVKIVKPNWKDAFSHIKPLIIFFIPSVAVSLYKVMDKIMLGNISGTTQVGFYENSEKIINMTLGIVTALGTVMMPRMTNLAAKGEAEQSRKVIDTSMSFILIVSIAMGFGIAGVSSIFAPVFFGDEFSSCDVLMMGLAISMPFTAFANVLRTQFLIPNKRDAIFLISVISGALANIVVNLIAIPKLGAKGAVIGTVIAEGTVCIIQAVYSRKELPIKHYFFRNIPYCFCGFIMFFITRQIGNIFGKSITTLIIQIITGICIYIGLCIIFMNITHDEMLEKTKTLLRNF